MNEGLFYRFAADEDHGVVATTPEGNAVSWANFLAPLTGSGVSPLDVHNIALLDFVHPKRWVNPSPKEVYNLVVIGAGAGGPVSVDFGATIVGAHAGDLISETSVAMRAGMGLGTLASVIHPYPTTAEAIRQTGDAYNRTRLTPVVERLFHQWLSLGQ